MFEKNNRVRHGERRIKTEGWNSIDFTYSICDVNGNSWNPGCVEHAFSIWEEIQKTKDIRGDITVIWLNLARMPPTDQSRTFLSSKRKSFSGSHRMFDIMVRKNYDSFINREVYNSISVIHFVLVIKILC